MAAIIATIGGCQKEKLTGRQLTDEVQPQFMINDPLFEGLNEIAFSVEDNRLVFENEEEFQKGIDFLTNLGDENFPKFEKAIGFESLLQSSREKDLECPIDDELLSTLLNPEKQIIVEHYLLELNPESEKVTAQFIGEDYNLKSTSLQGEISEYDFEDDVFALIKGESSLKSTMGSYCSGNEIENSYPDFIKAYVQYKNYGLYHKLKARLWNVLGAQYTLYYLRLKTVDSPYNPPAVPSNIYSRCFWKNKKDQDEFDRDFIRNNDWEVESRPYGSTRRLKGYRFDVDFTWQINSWDPIVTDNIRIECHKY